jgi:hypothetical protein
MCGLAWFHFAFAGSGDYPQADAIDQSYRERDHEMLSMSLKGHIHGLSE